MRTRSRSRRSLSRPRRPEKPKPPPELQPEEPVPEPLAKPLVQPVQRWPIRLKLGRLLVPIVTYCVAAVAHGAVVRLHGNTCGVDLFNISTWNNAIFTVGSTWCRGLSAVVQATTVLSENSAVHMLSWLM